MRRRVAYFSPDIQEARDFGAEFEKELELQPFDNAQHLLNDLAQGKGYDAILISAAPTSTIGLNLVRAITKDMHIHVPIFWLTSTQPPQRLQQAFFKAGVKDFFHPQTDKKKLLVRLGFYSGQNISGMGPNKKAFAKPNLAGKRAFDIMVASIALICLSPLFLVVALLIKLESKGPIFYYSYRVGTGYKIFKFWKFRSMRQDADQLLTSMKDLNQYQIAAAKAENKAADLAGVSKTCTICAANGLECQTKLVDSTGNMICEKQYQQIKKTQSGSAFIKIVNDPRITKVGMFIRNTSIDELPQLYNVLRGDMSIIGNRPLPLYEAEKVTTDEFAARFIAPAGITGLWQVSKRGKGDMSEEERKALDIEYASSYSMRRDAEILLKTIPALFQKENV